MDSAHRRSRSAAVVVLVSFAFVIPLRGESTSAQLSVVVTVARSCVVSAQAIARSTSHLRLECATGAARSLQMTTGMTLLEATSRSTELLAPTTPFSAVATRNDLRVATINF